jgi:hypothetical protein
LKSLICTLCACVLVLASVAPLHAQEVLGYRFTAGDSFDLVTTTSAEPPLSSPTKSTILSRTKVASAGPEGARLEQHIVSQVPGKPDYVTSFNFLISPEGQVSDVVLANPADTQAQLIARNISTAMPSLPNAAVAVGFKWSNERPVFLPRISFPGVSVPDQLRLVMDYQVAGTSTVNGQPALTLNVAAHESPGQKLQVKAGGTITLEPRGGKIFASHLEGVASMRVLLVKVNVPFKVDVARK